MRQREHACVERLQEAVESDHDGLVQISRGTAAIEVRTWTFWAFYN